MPQPIQINATAHLYPMALPSDIRRFAGPALREYATRRLGSGFSLEALAAHLQLDPRFCGRLLREESQPSLYTYTAILAAAELPLGSLLRGLSLTPPGPAPPFLGHPGPPDRTGQSTG